MKTFAINVGSWFWVAFAAAITKTKPPIAPVNRPICGAGKLPGLPIGRRHRHFRHHRRHARFACTYLEFVSKQAGRVAIAGSFNGWRPSATPMVSMGCGWWIKGLTLPPGRYPYRFVVDGRWVPDPNAVETEPGPDGRANSVLVVPGQNEIESTKPNA